MMQPMSCIDCSNQICIEGIQINERREKYMRKLRLMLAGSAVVIGGWLMANAPGYIRQGSSETADNEYTSVAEEEQDFVYVLNVGETSVILASLEEITEVINTVKDSYNDSDKTNAIAAQLDALDAETETDSLALASIEPEDRPIVMAAKDEVSQETKTENSFENKIEIVKIQSAGVQVMSVEEAADIVKSALWAVPVSQEIYSDY